MFQTDDLLNRANAIGQKLLTGSYIESYGVRHQLYFVDFKNDSFESRLIFDTDLKISPVLDNNKFTSSEQILIAMDRTNLHQVLSAECTDLSTLIIRFDGGISVSLAGDPIDQIQRSLGKSPLIPVSPK